jgi:hypothetical protein
MALEYKFLKFLSPSSLEKAVEYFGDFGLLPSDVFYKKKKKKMENIFYLNINKCTQYNKQRPLC